MITAFRKMHGLGNDFIVFDARETALTLTAEQVRALADRKRGIGCDQLIVMKPSGSADAYMEIWNADGSQVGACGNATRCIGDLLLPAEATGRVAIETSAGHLSAERSGRLISVNMGPALLDAAQIPVMANDTLAVDLGIDGLGAAICCSMGNPHATFFVEDADAVDLHRLGPLVETHTAFPEQVNAGFASMQDGAIRLRVWERGVGITDACGTAACAAAVAAVRSGRAARTRGTPDGAQSPVTILLDGGPLTIDWQQDGTVLMTGPVATSFIGEVAL